MNKRLVLSRTDRKIAGVCGGLAEYFGMKSDNVRLGFVVGALLGGGAIALYIILAIVMSET
ncbi:PspC domain-containing protein [Streptococcus merionis]|uniref:Phage shock protein C stress-responsive transcriptional regulator n=1 Tax=Streptococcus merionis TaxID=400065 RepID=A0A239SPU0_9STRE|nr:PspC domain-containing protein [Streptococcus merionis]SNU87430.1 phage shock protein C stress-responsive transcriptional regulator [Streptococcus merionis]